MAQKSRSDLLIQANVIKNETVANRNTQVRVGTMNIDEIDSSININDTEPNTWYINTDGDDSKAGSDKFPFENISAAIAVYAAGDIIQIIDEGYSSNENITISKKTIIKGPVANITGGAAFTQLQGTWTIDGGGISIIFENLTTAIDWSSSVDFNLDVINGAVGTASSFPARLTDLLLQNSFYSLGASSNLRSFECRGCTGVASALQIGRSLQLYSTSHQGSITSGLDASRTNTLRNSSIDTDLTITGTLDSEKLTVGGTLTVSGAISGGSRFAGQVTGQGKVISFDATSNFSFDNGNAQQMPVTGNVTSFVVSNEKTPGNYDVYLVNDGTAGRTVAAPTGWTADSTSETHTTAADAINRYQFYTMPDGSKYFNLHIVKS